PVGHLASRLLKGREQSVDTCFMRGALLHVEHLVILGNTAAVARMARRTVLPSQQALHQTFVRYGREIREALAAKWGLGDLLLGAEGETGVAEEYQLIRNSLIRHWLRLPIQDEASRLDGLASALAAIPPRVKQEADEMRLVSAG